MTLPAGTITENDKDYSIRAVGKFETIEDIEDLVLIEMPFPVIENPVTGEEMDLWEVLDAMKLYPEMFEGIDLFGGLTGLTSGMTSMPGMDTSSTETTSLDTTSPDTTTTSTDNSAMADMEMTTISIKLTDIATIDYIELEGIDYSKVNGEDSIAISLQKQNNVNTTDIAKLIKEEMTAIIKDYPDTAALITLDQAKYIDQMVSSVVINAIIGGILAVMILFIFLKDIRPTIIIGISIPVSIIAAFTALWLANITLNLVSLGGLALGIGMLVDNSVVVLENIYRMRKDGQSRVDAAVNGAKQVGGAIIASTLTTVAVFMPVMFVQGFTAEIFQEMAIVVSITLLASLIVALSLVPMMSSKLIKKPDTSMHHKAMDRARAFYSRILSKALRHRVAVVILTVVLFASSIFGVIQLGMELMPASDEGQISISVKMPKGTTFSDTVLEVKKVEEILTTFEEIDVVSASVTGGGNFMAAFMGGGSDTGSLTVILKPTTERDLETSEVADLIRDKVAGLTLAQEISVNAISSNMMGGLSTSPIEVSISAKDFDQLESLATEVASLVEGVEGTTEVDNGIKIGAPELNINLRPDKALAKGILPPTVAMALNEKITGIESTSITLEGRKVGIYINETKNNTVTLSDIPELTFTSMTGEEVLLADVADIEEGVGYTSINRTNQRRTMSVTSKLLDGYDAGTVGIDIDALISEMNIPDGYTVKVIGEYDDIMDAFGSLGLSLLLGIVIVYMIMASQFESFKYPFVILFSIPLAFTGGFIGLFITGTPLSIVSVLGFIVLSGIVVNNGIVLVDYINRLKETGMGSMAAILEAGPTRLRPILMTALTTILALVPSAIGFGEGAEMIQPLGITVIGGLFMSTFLTLVVVPVIYYMFDRKGRKADQESTDTENQEV
jgi:HAE1 family hydrophobic/amphiphilic exporter-1